MSAHTASLAVPQVAPHGIGRARAALGAVGAAVVGAAPHVLHHVGPLAGVALLAGAGRNLLFGAIGFATAVPLLRGSRRRTGSWRVPAALLSVNDGNDRPPSVSQPAGTDHGSHHP